MELGGHSRDDCRDGIRLLFEHSSSEGRGKQPASMPEASWAGRRWLHQLDHLLEDHKVFLGVGDRGLWRPFPGDILMKVTPLDAKES